MRIHAVLIAATLLAGCAGHPTPVAVLPAPVPAVAVATPPATAPAPTPINAGLSPAATLWHLRAGLNVAALACRGPGEATVIARYNALLAHHAAELRSAEAAYAAEYQQGGGNWRARYDDAMTRLYNFFGQPQGRDAFCAAADNALADLDALPDAALPADAAAARLARLDQPFAPPWLAVGGLTEDARVLGGPAVQMAAR